MLGITATQKNIQNIHILVVMMVQRASKSSIVPPAFFSPFLCQWWTLEYCKFSLLTLVSGIFLDCLFPITVTTVGFREENSWNYLLFSTVHSY